MEAVCLKLHIDRLYGAAQMRPMLDRKIIEGEINDFSVASINGIARTPCAFIGSNVVGNI